MEDYNIENGNNSNCKSGGIPVINYEDLEFSKQDHHQLQSSTNIGELPSCESMDSIFDELLMMKDTDHACTHYHTCNPPGPDFPHTHTCVHMHTKILGPTTSNNNDDSSGYHDDSAESKEHNSNKSRGCHQRGGGMGNREAVRKYRQKKKVYTMSLADEATKLKVLNQQLMQRLQGQSALEAEVARLKCLLVDIRGRIEGEIGSFPYQKPVQSGDIMFNHINPDNVNFSAGTSNTIIPCNSQCGDHVYCGRPGKGIVLNQGSGGCELGRTRDCMANLGSPPSFN